MQLAQGDSLSKMVQALRICNYIVENLRVNMKLQVEKYFTILMEIVVADPSKGLLMFQFRTNPKLGEFKKKVLYVTFPIPDVKIDLAQFLLRC